MRTKNLPAGRQGFRIFEYLKMKFSKTILLFSFLTISLCQNSFAQEDEVYYTGEEVEIGFARKKILYLQGWGDVFGFGVNFEKIYTRSEGFNLTARLGVGYLSGGVAVLCGNNMMIGKKNWLIEAGINPGLSITLPATYVIVSANVGLRYINRQKGTFLRLAYNPFIYANGNKSIPVAAGIGAAF